MAGGAVLLGPLGCSTADAGDLAAELHRGYEDGRSANERVEIWMAPESSPVLPR